jgi:hypothetical protein
MSAGLVLLAAILFAAVRPVKPASQEPRSGGRI